ncbi:rRNA adenine methyltransferase [Pedobacter sp. HMF7647]|uniref:rRNA adenine methyltransferase n=1 Tax=Hufsiella arboris TaxID=2695275 RepID=A0A7K1YB50_9SPHI|nr:rRNA adenine methyltransferase [Hufsiella arboris]MXV51329.1 rRNA adenine methyltransferase [Hufsiella arboris]
MQFEADNKIVKLCAKGMSLEGEGKNEEASKVFHQAWEEATNDKEKFTAAHYVARHQKHAVDKLSWDELALSLALKINDDSVKGAYPSLYLNIAKGYEDLEQFEKAIENYKSALDYSNFLNDDGYGKMIKNGVNNGLERIKSRLSDEK